MSSSASRRLPAAYTPGDAVCADKVPGFNAQANAKTIKIGRKIEISLIFC
jgi:hypothetical protein